MCVRHIRAIFETGIYPTSAKIVALCIAEHANTDGETWISQKAIAIETGCSVRGVQRQIATLKKANILLCKNGRALRLNPSLVAGLEVLITANDCGTVGPEPVTGGGFMGPETANDCGFANPSLVAGGAEKTFAIYAPAYVREEDLTTKEIVPAPSPDEPVTYPWDDE